MTKNKPYSSIAFYAAFASGLAAIAWIGAGFVGTATFGLVMTLVITSVYLAGAHELRRFRASNSALEQALTQVPQPLTQLTDWLSQLPTALQNAVRLRIEGERGSLPGLALTPYLIGLLVMLGMLGTFLGMVVTFQGAVFTLEGSADLQAIRSALSAPIKGLGLAFGTSVVGVATSAMLGLMSAIARRERMGVLRTLDARTATDFFAFTLAHQRQTHLQALQQQAGVLPAVANQLQTLMEQIERRTQQLDTQLVAQQVKFQQDATAAYAELAQSVEQSLKESLGISARVAGESIRSVVADAMATIAQTTDRQHALVSEAVQTQLGGLSAQFGATAATVAEGWSSALRQHALTSESHANGLSQALTEFTTTFEERSAALLTHVQQTVSQSQTEQTAAEQRKQAAWTQALQVMAATLQTEWQRLGEQTLAQQQALCNGLAQAAGAITDQASQQTQARLEDMARLMAQSEALVQARTASEAAWAQQHGERMDQLSSVLRTELASLRQDEALHLQTLRSDEQLRGDAAVARLGELQAAINAQVTSHLATLGTALEAPLTRLLETASVAPKAAAEVIAQLRQEMSQLAERDNHTLAERATLVGNMGSLLQTVQQTTGEQRTAIEQLVGSAAEVFEQLSRQFTQTSQAQTSRAEDVADRVASSASSLANLGEAFGNGVQQFSATNEKLIESLQRVEGAVSQSMARSDEQLAYYVAQAREVIDLSITSQQSIVEDLRRLRVKPVMAEVAP